MVPTMKYWKTFWPVSPPLLRYFFHLATGMSVVLEAEPPLKGLSKDAVAEVTVRFCTARAVADAARRAGNWARAVERTSALAVVLRAGMVERRDVADGRQRAWEVDGVALG